MAAAEFARSVEIAAPLDQVYAFLTEATNYVGLQPLLVDVRLDGPEDADGWTPFRSTERIHLFGIVPYCNSIAWKMKLVPEAPRIEFETRSFPRIQLRASYSFQASTPSTTMLTDSVAIACPRWLEGFVVREARRAHEALLQNLKERFDGTGC